MQGVMLSFASSKLIFFCGDGVMCFVLPFLLYDLLLSKITVYRYKGPSTDPGIITRTVEDIYKVLECHSCLIACELPWNRCCARVMYACCLSPFWQHRG